MARHPVGESATKPRHPKAEGRVLGRHGALLSDPKVLSWWEARSLRSRLSADTYLRQFGFLLERTKLSPPEIVALAKSDPDKLRDVLVRYAAQMKRDGRLDSYISKFFEGLKSYLRFHRVQFDGFPSLSPIKGESLATERTPTPEELASVLDRLSLRSRVCALFMAHSGLRPGVLGSYQAEGGLRLGDLPDLDLKTLTFAETPFAIRVPAALSKTRVSYVTFGSSQLESALLAYLSERRITGETLTSSSPTISVRSTRGVAERRRADPRYARGFVVTKAIVQEIHDALKATAPDGVRFRPYVLRSYMSSRLLMAEGAGAMTRDLREALMGHDLGISGRYTLSKRWGTETLRDARASYRRSESYLLAGAKPAEGDGDRLFRLYLKSRGVSDAALKNADLRGMDDAAILDLFEKIGAAPLPTTPTLVPDRPREEAVPVEEVPARARAGWLSAGPSTPAWVLMRAPPIPAG